MNKIYKVYIPSDGGYDPMPDEILGYYNTEDEAKSCVKFYLEKDYQRYHNITYEEILVKTFNIKTYSPFYCFYENRYLEIEKDGNINFDDLYDHIFFSNKQLDFTNGEEIEVNSYIRDFIYIKNVRIKLPIILNEKFRLSLSDYKIIEETLSNQFKQIAKTYKKYHEKNSNEMYYYYSEKHCHILNQMLFNISPPEHDFKIGDVVRFNPKSYGNSCEYGIIRNIQSYNVIECERYRDGGSFGSNTQVDASHIVTATKEEFEKYILNKENGEY